ncbi:MAG: hypothetical protein K8L97_06095 [Anaerolineae bacterium]|nr:hypothetical protein [Anaerolineae bacterium]
MAKKLKPDDLARIAEKLMELANLTIAALGIGQILSGHANLLAAIAGIVVFLGLYYSAFQVLKGR